MTECEPSPSSTAVTTRRAIHRDVRRLPRHGADRIELGRSTCQPWASAGNGSTRSGAFPHHTVFPRERRNPALQSRRVSSSSAKRRAVLGGIELADRPARDARENGHPAPRRESSPAAAAPAGPPPRMMTSVSIDDSQLTIDYCALGSGDTEACRRRNCNRAIDTRQWTMTLLEYARAYYGTADQRRPRSGPVPRWVGRDTRNGASSRRLRGHSRSLDPIGSPDPGIVLIRQYRWAAESVMWEIPAGTLDAGESPEHCAHRELREEAGVEAAASSTLRPSTPRPGSPTSRSISTPPRVSPRYRWRTRPTSSSSPTSSTGPRSAA